MTEKHKSSKFRELEPKMESLLTDRLKQTKKTPAVVVAVAAVVTPPAAAKSPNLTGTPES